MSKDTVYRQDAIDAVEFGITYAKAINKSTGEVKELFKEGNKALNEAVERLKELPSAEPKTPSNGSITSINPENTHDRTMGDLISRQDAIRLAEQGQIQGFEWQFKKLCTLPSAEKTQLSGEDATSVCKCPCEYREPCDYCYYDAYRGHGCPAEEGLKDE